MNEFINSMFNNPVIDSSTTKATWLMIGVASVLAPLFYAIAVGWNIANTATEKLEGTQSKKIGFSVKELVRVSILMALLNSVYFPVFYTVNNLCYAVVKATTPTDDGTAAGKKDFALMLKGQINGPDWDVAKGDNNTPENPPSTPEIEAQRYAGYVGGWVVDVLSVAAAVIVGIIRVVIQAACLYLGKIFFSIGPLVIVFSILPMFQDKLANWFGVYLNILLTPMMCNLFDFVIYSNIQSSMAGNGSIDPLSSLAYNVAVILVYCLSFWLTSFVVGASSAGRVLSTGVSVVSMGISKMLGGASSAASNFGGGDVWKNATDTTKSAK